MPIRRPTRKTPNTWEVYVQVGYKPDGRPLRVWKTVKGSKQDAKRVEAALLAQVSDGSYVPETTETVAAYLDRWLRDRVRPRLAPKTVAGYETIVRRYLVPTLGHLRLRALQPLHIEQAQHAWAALADPPLEPKSVANIYAVLRAALRRAVRWRLLARSPSEGVDPPRWRAAEPAWLDLDALARLLDHLGGTDWYLPTLVLASTGLRVGELLGLRWLDLRLREPPYQLTITQQLQRLRVGQDAPEAITVAPHLVLRTVKSHRSRRPVAIDVELAAALRAHRVAQDSIRLHAGPGRWQPWELVFCDTTGAPLSEKRLRAALRAACHAAGVPDVTPHGLRHSHASTLVAAGVPMKVVQERLGHSTFLVTANTYSHVAPDTGSAAAEAFAAGLRRAQEAPHDPRAGAKSGRKVGTGPHTPAGRQARA